jgi:predicted O-methyltransferase YrrM
LPREAAGRLETLQAAYPWPPAPPDVPARKNLGWLFPSTKELLQQVVKPEHRLIVELGSFVGLSTRFLADLAPQATIVAIDHWRGSPEHFTDPKSIPVLPILYETFLASCWDYRSRLVPLRMPTLDGLEQVARYGLCPDLIFVDASHAYEAVKADLETARRLFPRAALVGDDWDWDGVRQAVSEVAREQSLKLQTHGVAWRLS